MRPPILVAQCAMMRAFLRISLVTADEMGFRPLRNLL